LTTTSCKKCGLEEENSRVDFGAEWRSFSQKNGGASLGERSSIFRNKCITETGLLTSLSKADASLGRFKRTIDSYSKPKCYFKDIDSLCDALNLNVCCIRDRAAEISADMITNGLLRSTQHLTLHAASILYAARIQGGDFNRTFREIAMVTSRPQKEIARCFKFIENALMRNQSSSIVAVEHPIVSFARNYAVYLKMPRKWVLFTEAFARNVLPGTTNNFGNQKFFQKAWEGRSRASIAATVVYIVSRVPSFPVKIDVNTIALRTSVRVSTIMTCYRDMLPVIEKLFDGVLENVTVAEVMVSFKTDLLSLRSSEHLIT
jgi:transcription initiation factor TFIIIB Brf1 subunit/transcription initiation factor TFIIB